MLFNYSYKGNTTVNSGVSHTEMSFSPDVKRDPTFFRGELAKSLEFREAISALHDVVVSDLRYKAKDKTDYKEWAAQRDLIELQQVTEKRKDVANKIKVLQQELTDLHKQSQARLKPYNDALWRFRRYVWEKNLDIAFIFDPVITVHPDEVFFECFSKDESTYGRLGASYEVFKNINEYSCGTTNVDYSAALYNEFQKIRTYKSTNFQVDPSGFEVHTSDQEQYKEVKIDLPDSWVRGFLQVSSAMSLPATKLELHPMDLYNICLVLRRKKEQKGPRSLRYHLTPGEPVKLVFEPWEIELSCPRSIFKGGEANVIRVWGRRRLLTLERLIPIARKFTVYLIGTGLPSFYIADLGDMSFTLGLSGWTANDWASAGNFDLMAPRADVDEYTKKIVFNSLKSRWVDDPLALATGLGLDRATVLGALSAYTQAGRAIYDLNKQVYRVRELSRELLPLEKLRFANEREEVATRFLIQKSVKIVSSEKDGEGMLVLRGSVSDRGKIFSTSLTIDRDERILRADCGCNWHQQNKLYKGPCEHILATRMQYARGTSG
ncbi:MAG: SWIM zinc finger family protein [Blastocatellia bacterium]|nr:SWIM zinc finger family protein [Blastocatellia bacterium]